MDNEILWEVVLSYLGDGARAARTCKLVNVAARCAAELRKTPSNLPFGRVKRR